MTEKIFREKAPGLVERLLKEPFGFSVEDACAILGNAGHESGGLTALQEISPTSGRGGYGWFQWTGPRRREFEEWAKRKGWMAWSDEANYSFLIRELMTTEKRAVEAVKSAVGLEDKVKAFELAYERAGVKHYASRNEWARRALEAYSQAKPKEAEMVPVAGAVANIAVPVLVDLIGKVVDKALNKTAADPASPVPAPAAEPAAKAEVKAEVVKEVLASPELAHATNQEPWYQKRSRWATIISLVVTVAGPLLARYGITVDARTQAFLAEALPIIGGVWTAYLAYRAGTASRPLGS